MVLKQGLLSFRYQFKVLIGSSIGHNNRLIRMGHRREARTLIHKCYVTINF